MAARVLIAGFGNVLRGDDGFGVAVVHRLQAEGRLGPGVELMEVGTGGLRLAQELLAGYDLLVVVDAVARGGTAGEVSVVEVEAVEPATEVDLHLAVPARALAVAQALGSLPARVVIVGCEAAEVDELSMELSPPVQAAVATAVGHIERLVGAVAPAGAEIGRRDEVLQLLYWLEGEGFQGSATLGSVARFLTWPEAEAAATLAELGRLGLVRLDETSGEHRLTAPGRGEAARRFAEEFSPMLAQGHGECNDPDCECRRLGPAECRTRRD